MDRLQRMKCKVGWLLSSKPIPLNIWLYVISVLMCFRLQPQLCSWLQFHSSLLANFCLAFYFTFLFFWKYQWNLMLTDDRNVCLMRVNLNCRYSFFMFLRLFWVLWAGWNVGLLGYIYTVLVCNLVSRGALKFSLYSSVIHTIPELWKL